MASFNQVTLLGNLTRDPELKYTPSGKCIAEFGLAVNRKYTTESGEKKEETTFVDITFFAKTAEVVGKYLRKGDPVLLTGRLKLDQWEDKNGGGKRSKLSVVGDSMQLIGQPRGEDRQQQAAPQPQQHERPARPQSPISAGRPAHTVPDDDVPF